MVNRPVFELISPEDQKLGTFGIHPIENTEGIFPFVEQKFIREDGSLIAVETAAVKLIFNKLPAIQVTVRDISQRKELEEGVFKTLEKEKELSNLKAHFVTMASHEFRTPLTTILSSSELLEHYEHKWSTEKKRELFGRINTSVHEMTQLLEDVLQFGRAEDGKLELKPELLDLCSFSEIW